MTLDLLLGSIRLPVVNRCGKLGRQLTQALWVAAGCCGVAAVKMELMALVPGLMLLLIALFAMACGQGMLRKLTPAGSWAASGLTMLLLLLASAQLILPAYAKRYAMRNQIRGQLIAGTDPSVPVICYPRCWDSVSFYLAHRRRPGLYA